MALTSLPAVKAFLNVTDTSQDAWLNALLAAAEASVRSYCNQRLEEWTYTEYYNGTGTRALPLRQRPVSSITSIYLDHGGFFDFGTSTPFDSDSLLTSGEDYALDLDGEHNGSSISYSGVVYRLNTIWAIQRREFVPGKLHPETGPNFGNLKVTYVAGYNPVPQDLQYAVALVVSYMKLTAPLGGQPLSSEKIGEYSYRIHHPNFRANAPVHPMLGEAKQILNRYREVSF